jgi:hypothetical protein
VLAVVKVAPLDALETEFGSEDDELADEALEESCPVEEVEIEVPSARLIVLDEVDPGDVELLVVVTGLEELALVGEVCAIDELDEVEAMNVDAVVLTALDPDDVVRLEDEVMKDVLEVVDIRLLEEVVVIVAANVLLLNILAMLRMLLVASDEDEPEVVTISEVLAEVLDHAVEVLATEVVEVELVKVDDDKVGTIVLPEELLVEALVDAALVELDEVPSEGDVVELDMVDNPLDIVEVVMVLIEIGTIDDDVVALDEELLAVVEVTDVVAPEEVVAIVLGVLAELEEVEEIELDTDADVVPGLDDGIVLDVVVLDVVNVNELVALLEVGVVLLVLLASSDEVKLDRLILDVLGPEADVLVLLVSPVILDDDEVVGIGVVGDDERVEVEAALEIEVLVVEAVELLLDIEVLDDEVEVDRMLILRVELDVADVEVETGLEDVLGVDVEVERADVLVADTLFVFEVVLAELLMLEDEEVDGATDDDKLVVMLEEELLPSDDDQLVVMLEEEVLPGTLLDVLDVELDERLVDGPLFVAAANIFGEAVPRL